MSDDMVDASSYFSGHADAIEVMIERQAELKETLVHVFKQMVDTIIDDSISNLVKIRDGMLEKASNKESVDRLIEQIRKDN